MCCSVLHIRSAIQMTRDLYTLRDTPSRRPIECLLMNTHRMPSLMHHLPQISHTTDVLTQTEIRKSPTADKFALQNDCRVHFREFLPAWAPHRCADSGQNPQKPAHYPVCSIKWQKSGLLRISTWVGTEQMCRLSLKFWKVRSTVIFKGLGFRD